MVTRVGEGVMVTRVGEGVMVTRVGEGVMVTRVGEGVMVTRVGEGVMVTRVDCVTLRPRSIRSIRSIDQQLHSQTVSGRSSSWGGEGF